MPAMRMKKRTSKKNPDVKIGNCSNRQKSFAFNGTAKFIVSLPNPGSRYLLRRMKESVKQHLGEEASLK